MGMFSWVCKGCGEELVHDEVVRLDGNVGVYDGYGRAGRYDHHSGDPVAWHEACYKKASGAQRASKKRSDPARNQGFGPPKLEHMRGYAPEGKTVFTAEVEVLAGPNVYRGQYGPGPEYKVLAPSHYPLLIVTTTGVEDMERWKKDEAAAEAEMEQAEADETEGGYSREEYESEWDWKTAPASRAKEFETLAEALAEAKKAATDCTEYVIRVWGLQRTENVGYVRGEVYRFHRDQVREHYKKINEKGEFDGYKVIETGKYAEKEYVWSRGM
jgi:hypothetical protein